MPLGQTAFLILVIAHFTTFLAVLGGVCLYTWLPDRRPAPKAALGKARLA